MHAGRRCGVSERRPLRGKTLAFLDWLDDRIASEEEGNCWRLTAAVTVDDDTFRDLCQFWGKSYWTACSVDVSGVAVCRHRGHIDYHEERRRDVERAEVELLFGLEMR
jgi:hypothetical protein